MIRLINWKLSESIIFSSNFRDIVNLIYSDDNNAITCNNNNDDDDDNNIS